MDMLGGAHGILLRDHDKGICACLIHTFNILHDLSGVPSIGMRETTLESPLELIIFIDRERHARHQIIVSHLLPRVLLLFALIEALLAAEAAHESRFSDRDAHDVHFCLQEHINVEHNYLHIMDAVSLFILGELRPGMPGKRIV